MRVLFVCSGNICRSPMAEALFNHAADRRGKLQLHAESAGTLGINGSPASPEAIASLAEWNIDLREHRSRGLDATLVRAADVVVSMAGEHQAHLRRRYPGTQDGWLILAFAGGAEPLARPLDLDDPVGEPLPIFCEQRDQLSECVEHLITFLDSGGRQGQPPGRGGLG